VPADAHRLYPCFDQPDLKATFALELDLPDDWIAVANGAELARTPSASGRRQWTFAETAPLPTYLMAFACGSFELVQGPRLDAPGTADAALRMFVRPSQRRLLDAKRLLSHSDMSVSEIGYHLGFQDPSYFRSK
jgi:aminopeptidase N